MSGSDRDGVNPSFLARLRDVTDEVDPLIEFHVGRWTISIFNPRCIGYWAWRNSGYDCLWDEWGFGFLLQLERETDYLLWLAENYPAKDGGQ